jgi:PilZ domain
MDSRRRQHRIIYQTKIRMRAPGRDDSVVARVQNLSSTGMFVTAADLPDPGTEVQCRLTLGGEPRTLRGRVAWVRPASPLTPLKSPGAGIEFLDLEARDSELLTRLVEPQEERRPVDVWFEGMAAPVRCQAVVVGESVRLETRLPFMRLHSPVKVIFSKEPPDTREGVLDGVTLEPSPDDGVPALRIAVMMPPLDSAQGTIEAREAKSTPAAPAPEALTVVDPAIVQPGPRVVLSPNALRDPERTQKIGLGEVTPGVSPAPTVLPPPAPVAVRPARWPALLFGVVLGVGLAAGGALWLARSGLPLVDRLPPALLPPLPPAPAPAEVTPVPPPPTTATGEIAPPPATGETTPPPAETPSPVAEAAGPEIEQLVPAVPEEPLPEGVAVEREGEGAILSIALAGTSAGLKTARRDDGLEVVLPRGRPQAGFGSFTAKFPAAAADAPAPLVGDEVRFSIRRRGGGSQLRVFYDARALTGQLTSGGDGLRLVLAPK